MVHTKRPSPHLTKYTGHNSYTGISRTRTVALTHPSLAQVGKGELQQANIWFGKAGCVSPAHVDPFYNFLCNLNGRKYVRVFPYEIGDK